ncbi:M23 family metallopeptidase [Magnetospirillum sp. UT-4]|uniref:M23 family metallopeptidase n=1 Tax=Magnetospirillum sp. UT-4 TaxID=2681467 RepID=UPI0015729C4D|nr:M23 family metallopeptidase [Magnetospirillum sp. UT-4]
MTWTKVCAGWVLWPAAVAFFLAAAVPARAEAPGLGLPLDCRLGETCWLMNYVDTDPGPAAADFRCRARSYDGHGGTDFAVRDRTVAATVVAAAAGTVAGLRDGEPDGAFLAGGRSSVASRECGNGVVLRHGDGWETQYCHLSPGSVTVTSGQAVTAGTPLGRVGLSGMSEFPHVHLELRHQGRRIDPFTGGAADGGCGTAGNGLWRDPLPYQGATLYAAGFADRVPDKDALKRDAATPATLSKAAPALVLWGALFGIEGGDVVRLTLTAPDGTERLRRDADPAARTQAWRFEAAGIKAPAGGLAAGTWRGTVELRRGGAVVEARSVAVEVRP